jgi:flavorubredoxin/flavin reductase (DIM6/NTAB) family NADH-FMN oxidoreductase RutF
VDSRHADAYGAIAGIGDVDFIACLHAAPRRMDALAAAIAARPAGAECVEVLCSNPGAQVIQQALKANNPLTNENLIAAWKGADGKLRARLRVVKNNEKIDLGDRTLTFTTAPTPRWPDLIFARDDASGMLFTSKFFSAHVASEGDDVSDVGGWEAFGEDWRYFYDCLLAPMAKQVAPVLSRMNSSSETGADGDGDAPASESDAQSPVALKRGGVLGAIGRLFSVGGKAEERVVSATYDGVAAAICPAHGPIIQSSVTEVFREYTMWTEKQIASASNLEIAVIYASAYGNTGAMAQAIARGISKTGIAAEMFNCELATPDEISQLLKRCSGFCLGAPTLGGTLPTPVQTALGAIIKDGDLDKPCGVFGSFGWSGEAVDMMEKRLKDGGFKFAFDPLRCKFKPTAETLQLCEESGTDLAQAVRKLERRRQVLERKSVGKAESAVSDTAAAVGRIVGSLCAVTTKSEDTQSAMLASWVSQASFNPPALTVAVAKERAVESFLMKGGKFNLNVLKEGGEKDVMKALLKPFKPGENRFGDLDVSISENNGCAIVNQSLACIECSVTQRMEAGDHWIVLAEVESGSLLDEVGVTSIHHRKSGASY